MGRAVLGGFWLSRSCASVAHSRPQRMPRCRCRRGHRRRSRVRARQVRPFRPRWRSSRRTSAAPTTAQPRASRAAAIATSTGTKIALDGTRSRLDRDRARPHRRAVARSPAALGARARTRGAARTRSRDPRSRWRTTASTRSTPTRTSPRSARRTRGPRSTRTRPSSTSWRRPAQGNTPVAGGDAGTRARVLERQVRQPYPDPVLQRQLAPLHAGRSRPLREGPRSRALCSRARS